jgi:hypothetical protein
MSDKKGANNDIDMIEKSTYNTLKKIVIANLNENGRRRENNFL